MAKKGVHVEERDYRRGGSTEAKVPTRAPLKVPTVVKTAGAAAGAAAKASAKAGAKTTKIVGGATVAIVLAVGKFSLKRLVPWWGLYTLHARSCPTARKHTVSTLARLS